MTTTHCCNCKHSFVTLVSEKTMCKKCLMPMIPRLLYFQDVAETCTEFKLATGFFAWLGRVDV